MKLYTLQQCFKQAGSKFPFTVRFLHSEEGVKYDHLITFVSREENTTRAEGMVKRYSWIPKNCHGNRDFQGEEGRTTETCVHDGFALQSCYSWKEVKFNVDLKEVLR